MQLKIFQRKKKRLSCMRRYVNVQFQIRLILTFALLLRVFQSCHLINEQFTFREIAHRLITNLLLLATVLTSLRRRSLDCERA